MKTPDAAQLAALFPAPRTITIAARSIEIKRCTISQAGRLVDAGMPLYQRMQEQDGPQFLDLFEQFPNETTALIVAATGLEAEWVAALDPLDQFTLASEWMEVNAAFFVQRLLPPLARYMGAMGASIGAGLTSSIASNPTGTPAPTITPPKRPPRILNPSRAPNGAAAATA